MVVIGKFHIMAALIQGKEPQGTGRKYFGGLHFRYGNFGNRRLVTPAVKNDYFFCRPARNQVTIVTELSRLHSKRQKME